MIPHNIYSNDYDSNFNNYQNNKPIKNDDDSQALPSDEDRVRSPDQKNQQQNSYYNSQPNQRGSSPRNNIANNFNQSKGNLNGQPNANNLNQSNYIPQIVHSKQPLGDEGYDTWNSPNRTLRKDASGPANLNQIQDQSSQHKIQQDSRFPQSQIPPIMHTQSQPNQQGEQNRQLSHKKTNLVLQDFPSSASNGKFGKQVSSTFENNNQNSSIINKNSVISNNNNNKINNHQQNHRMPTTENDMSPTGHEASISYNPNNTYSEHPLMMPSHHLPQHRENTLDNIDLDISNNYQNRTNNQQQNSYYNNYNNNKRDNYNLGTDPSQSKSPMVNNSNINNNPIFQRNLSNPNLQNTNYSQTSNRQIKLSAQQSTTNTGRNQQQARYNQNQQLVDMSNYSNRNIINASRINLNVVENMIPLEQIQQQLQIKSRHQNMYSYNDENMIQLKEQQLQSIQQKEEIKMIQNTIMLQQQQQQQPMPSSKIEAKILTPLEIQYLSKTYRSQTIRFFYDNLPLNYQSFLLPDYKKPFGQTIFIEFVLPQFFVSFIILFLWGVQKSVDDFCFTEESICDCSNYGSSLWTFFRQMIAWKLGLIAAKSEQIIGVHDQQEEHSLEDFIVYAAAISIDFFMVTFIGMSTDWYFYIVMIIIGVMIATHTVRFRDLKRVLTEKYHLIIYDINVFLILSFAYYGLPRIYNSLISQHSWRDGRNKFIYLYPLLEYLMEIVTNYTLEYAKIGTFFQYQIHLFILGMKVGMMTSIPTNSFEFWYLGAMFMIKKLFESTSLLYIKLRKYAYTKFSKYFFALKEFPDYRKGIEGYQLESIIWLAYFYWWRYTGSIIPPFVKDYIIIENCKFSVSDMFKNVSWDRPLFCWIFIVSAQILAMVLNKNLRFDTIKWVGVKNFNFFENTFSRLFGWYLFQVALIVSYSISQENSQTYTSF